MTAPTIREAQKGVLAAATVRILIIPAIVVIPGVVGYQLFGPMGDASYGRVVAHVLPGWMSGAFAALMAAAVVAHTAAILNSSVALYAIDFHDRFIRAVRDHWRLAAIASIAFTLSSILLVPVYENPEAYVRIDSDDSIINLLQKLNGLSSMPILSAFIVGLLFRNVNAWAAVAGLVWGVGFYAAYTFWWQPEGMVTLHYIHFMVIVLVTSVAAALAVNRFGFGQRAQWVGLADIRGTPN
jgi:SSS family solute:Na+ symporter